MMIRKFMFRRSRILTDAISPIKNWSLRVALCCEAEKLDKIRHDGPYIQGNHDGSYMQGSHDGSFMHGRHDGLCMQGSYHGSYM